MSISTLRSILAQEPSSHTWQELLSYFQHLPEEFLELHLAYAKEHTRNWPFELCSLTLGQEEHPAFPLVKNFRWDVFGEHLPEKILQKLAGTSLPFLTISGKKLSSLKGLEQISSLEHLRLFAMDNLLEMDSISQLSNLRTINISSCPNISQLDCLKPLRHLESIELWFLNKLELLPAAMFPKLRELTLFKCTKLEKLPNTQIFPNLEELQCNHCENLNNIEGLRFLPNLKKLSFIGNPNIHAPKIDGLVELEHLILTDCTSIEHIHGLEHTRNLKELHVGRCSSLKKIEGLEKLENLEKIDCMFCHSLEYVGTFPQKNSLKSLLAGYNKSLNKLDGFQHLTNLRVCNLNHLNLELETPASMKHLVELHLSSWHDISGFLVYFEQSNYLEELDLSFQITLEDLDFLSFCPHLYRLNISHCYNLRSIKGLAFCEKLTLVSSNNCHHLQKMNESHFSGFWTRTREEVQRWLDINLQV